MNLIDRAKAILFTPKTEWERIKNENDSHVNVLTTYLLWLALIPAAAALIGYGIIGYRVLGVHVGSIEWGIRQAIMQFITMVGGCYITAGVLTVLAENFGAKKDFNKAFQLVAYCYTAACVGGIGIAPFVGYAERHPTPGVLSMVFGHRLPEDCYPVESLGERIDVESFHENTSEDLEWFLNHVRSRIEAYAERNGLVLACGPAPFLKAVQGFALAAKARCQLSLESRMACGVGACLGCVTKTTEKWPVEEKAGTPVQTCTHGPVFWADQITLEA